MEQKNKRFSEEYYNMMNSHREALNRINKKASKRPWEYSYALDYLIEFIKFMRDYYDRHENVMAIERREEDFKKYKNVPTRLETLEKTLYYFEMWTNAEDRYVRVINHPETYKSHFNEDGTITVDNLGFHCEYLCGKKFKTGRKAMLRCYKRISKEKKKYKHLFFKTLEKYMEEWWD